MLQLMIVPECQETLQQSTHMSVSMQDLKAHSDTKMKNKTGNFNYFRIDITSVSLHHVSASIFHDNQNIVNSHTAIHKYYIIIIGVSNRNSFHHLSSIIGPYTHCHIQKVYSMFLYPNGK